MIPELYGEYRPDAVTGGKWKSTGREQSVNIAKASIKARGPETSWHFFHPSRVDIRHAPDGFLRELKGIDERLDCVWHPIHQRWCVWFRKPEITFKLCPGWLMLFVVQYPDGTFMPLDNRTLAETWTRSPKLFGYSGKKYFDQVLGQIRRDYVKKESDRTDQVVQKARDHWRFAQIKNIGQGNKYTNHEVGD